MTNPLHYLWRMLLFLAIVAGVAVMLSGTLSTALAANPVLDAVILGVLLIGILWNIRQVVSLRREVFWVEAFRNSRDSLSALPAPKLLAPMASMLSARASRAPDGAGRVMLSAPAMRSLLDSIQSRLDESRELSRYMTGLMIFLGLLGTFYGLLLTVSSVGDVIAGMSVGSGDVAVLFNQLKTGLAEPLRGMGTAFSVSMLGLAGALVLGFLDLTAGQAQNRFFNELEEWLAASTRLSSGAMGDGGEASVPVYVQALLEQTAENMENLQRILARGEDGRREANQAVLSLTEKLSTMSDALRSNQQLMLKIAEGQQAMAPVLQRLAQGSADDVAHAHLRNIEALLNRLLADAEQGRGEATQEIRSEIRLLTRTIERLSTEQPR